MRILYFLRRIAFIIFLAACFLNVKPQGIHTSGNLLLGVCGDTIILRGINYAPYDWGSDNTQLLVNEVAQTGANTVRMTWYSYSNLPAYTNALLDTAIGTCIRYKMIPVIELHNITCDFNVADVDTLANWYTSPGLLSIISKYQSSLIIDIANEAGAVNWAGNPATAQQQYIVTYDSVVHKLRNAGIAVPLMIDAPDCGTSIDILSNVAANIIASDPLHNIIFSSHAYWYAYANNDSATMQQLITTAIAGNFPFVMGEVANYQDSSDNSGNSYYCHWALNYPALLNICKQNNIGWLVWSWNNDQCSLRQLSGNGTYSNLSPYGMDIVNNSNYGLHSSSHLTSYLANNGVCNNTNGINDINAQAIPYTIYNNNGIAYLKSQAADVLQLNTFDELGRRVQQAVVSPGQTIALPQINIGIVQVYDGNTRFASKFISQ